MTSTASTVSTAPAGASNSSSTGELLRGQKETTSSENIDSNVKTNNNSNILLEQSGVGEQQGIITNSKANLVLDSSSKAPVPNFRVEGTDNGDSSITVSVGILTSSTVNANNLVKSDNECASLVDSSLGTETETEEPGVTTASTNGDILSSLQSSEPDEMPLSLVSWYSEPGDCSSSASGAIHCCQHARNELSTKHSISEFSDVVNNSTSSNNTSSITPTAGAGNTTSGKLEDFLSEEKENKTPFSASANTSSTSNTHSSIPIHKKKESHGLPKTNHNSESQQCSASSHAPTLSSRKTTSSQRQVTGSSSTSSSSSPAVVPSNSKKGNKMHVQVFEQKSETSHNSIIASGGGCSLIELNKDGKQRIECPRCSRRSKSGSTTPATAPSRSSSSRRVIGQSHHHHHQQQQSQLVNGTTGSSSNFIPKEHKKPIKSILKSESRSGGSRGSASGSDKQSSMDSLGSNSGVNTMTRSDTGPRTKFYFNNNNSSDSVSYPEDKMVSKLKRIEKYATVRVKKSKGTSNNKPSCSEESGSATNNKDQRRQRTNSECGDGNNFIPDLMTKSMSFLEKSTTPFSHQHHPRGGGGAYGPSNSSGPSSLKRQGSLKIRKPSPGWEPGATRTSALRLLKMQENKAKVGGGISVGQTQGTSGSTHSGSGESIHNNNSHSITSTTSHSTSRANNSGGHVNKERGGHHSSSSAKVFNKLSSAFGQTASSSMKRLKQEKSVQTEHVTVTDSSVSVPLSTTASNNSPNSSTTISKIESPASSPEPAALFDGAAATIVTIDQQTEQIRHLESLVKRYKTSALRFQQEFERTENKNIELKKQLQENQMESTEMLEFLQAEKSTLAESLVEVETECKKLTRELESVVKESQSRCSSLVRLSEQHKQEALKSQTLLQRVESHKNTKIAQQMTQLTKGTEAIHGIKTQILTLIETLMKTYKVSQERLAMDGFEGAGQNVDETQLRCSLLLPLIKSLSHAFEVFKQQVKSNSNCTAGNNYSTVASNVASSNPSEVQGTTVANSTTTIPNSAKSNSEINSGLAADNNSDSLQNLNKAILDRKQAETIGLDSIAPSSMTTNVPSGDDLSLHDELEQLQVALRKLCTVIRIIVIHCDQKVSNVASDILQVLKSETDKLGLDVTFQNGSATLIS